MTTLIARPPSPAGIRLAALAAALAGVLLGDLVAPVAVPVLPGGTAPYGRRTGLGVRRSLAAMNLPVPGDAR
jgi:hypothetical protein